MTYSVGLYLYKPTHLIPSHTQDTITIKQLFIDVFPAVFLLQIILQYHCVYVLCMHVHPGKLANIS